jgi:hypothetical protein
MEVLVEQYQVFPVWVALELLGPAVHWPPTILIAQENSRQPGPKLLSDPNQSDTRL